MFSQLVNLITEANVNLKSQNYTGKQSLFGQQLPSSKRSAKAQSEKKKKKISPEREIISAGDDLIDIRSSSGMSDSKISSDFERAVASSKGSTIGKQPSFRNHRRLVEKQPKERRMSVSKSAKEMRPSSAKLVYQRAPDSRETRYSNFSNLRPD